MSTKFLKALPPLQVLGLLGLALLGPMVNRAAAQNPSTGTLRTTVVDQTGAVIVGASVVVSSEDTSGATPTRVVTGEAGLATVAGLRPGRYTITAEFSGFETNTLKGVRIRGGDNKQVVVLSIARVEA
jgi:hypothetical protein